MTTNRMIPLGSLLLLLATATIDANAQENDRPLEGVWSAEQYVLRDGPTHRVSGRIFFSGNEWTVLFFVLDSSGSPKRGSAEGGTFTLLGTDLVFSHLFHLSVGDEMEGLPASPLRLETHRAAEAPAEPSTISLTGNELTIFFPSGNRLEFNRV
jgi:hypothetical protein